MDKLFELFGVIYGDGHVHTTENRITITGSLEDFYYYSYYLKPLILSLFNVNVNIRKDKVKNSYRLVFENKSVFNKILSYGLKRGKKVGLIPFNLSNSEEIIAFLRGLFDTDGSLKFSKQSKDYNYYPRIQFAFLASPFSENLGSLFSRLGFNYSRWYSKRDNEYYYHISGKENLIKWFQLVGFSNLVHLSKYLFWLKKGFYVPRSTLDDRLKALDLKIEDLFRYSRP
tara:strand:+ start:391 stop:1074 length:684 start_codon:yes stop_codon:yes gene_type:complete